MKTLNINSKVRIKLTAYGIEKLKEEHEEFRKRCPSFGEFIPPKTDVNGYCEMQLWRIMQLFGEDMYNGATKHPFEANIQIDDSNFE